MTTPSQRRLRIHFLQAGYSDCIIIECKMWEGAHDSHQEEPLPKDCLHYRSMIVDGGLARGPLNQNVHDYCSKHLGWEPERRFDYQLLTHFHEDHVLGLVEQKIRSAVIIDPGLDAGIRLRTNAVKPMFSVPLKQASIDNYFTWCQEQSAKRKATDPRTETPSVWTIPPFACIGKVAPDEHNTPRLDQPGCADINFHWLFGGGVLAPLVDKDDGMGKPIFASRGEGIDTEQKAQFSPNLVSLGFVIEWGDFLFYSAGDAFAPELEDPTFDALLGAGAGKDGVSAPAWMRSGDKLKSFSVVKSSHHGSATSVGTSSTGSEDLYWLQRINPDTVVMLANLKHSNLPSEVYSEALLKTAMRRQNDGVDFGVYFWNDFSVLCNNTALKDQTVANLNKLLALNSTAADAARGRVLTNFSMTRAIGFSVCTNRTDHEEPSSLSSVGEKKRKRDSIGSAPHSKKRKSNEDSSDTSEDAKFRSPLALVIEVSDATLDPHAAGTPVPEAGSEVAGCVSEPGVRRRLHIERQILRVTTADEMNKTELGECCPRLNITINFKRPLPIARNAVLNLLCKPELLTATGTNKFAYFCPEEDGKSGAKARCDIEAILRDPFRRLYSIANTVACQITQAGGTHSEKEASLGLVLGSLGHNAEMAFVRVLVDKLRSTRPPAEEEKKKKKKKKDAPVDPEPTAEELGVIAACNVFRLRTKGNAWPASEILRIADEVAMTFISMIWTPNKRGGDYGERNDFSGQKYPSRAQRDLAETFLNELYSHPVFGIVAVQLLGSTRRVTANEDPVLRRGGDGHLNSALAANQRLFEDLGLSKAEFDPDLFYPIAREGTP
ncbi:hypothetical protein HF313_16685 [Massilia atriviolacea]|uniref:Uncharacterized protein n=1 Tax=Massilia atriviolacea TaxID=2495579 RepID=A0A430HU13_9BURK|nr:hypothetical protein [Massilia atriviolacea]RSZ61061.1 hypothetical protein EJB06_02735 [Massilia atriviolacea]